MALECKELDREKRSAQHCEQVSDHLRAKIADAGGQISFAEFMSEALYAPGLGYYSAGSTKFGADGDFITAPEVSSVFGSVLARQCAEVLSGINANEVLEIGAGSGKLAVDMLTAFEKLAALPTQPDRGRRAIGWNFRPPGEAPGK